MCYRLRGDMDASLVSSLYLMPHWLERLVEDYEDEGESKAFLHTCIKIPWQTCLINMREGSGSIPGM